MHTLLSHEVCWSPLSNIGINITTSCLDLQSTTWGICKNSATFRVQTDSDPCTVSEQQSALLQDIGQCTVGSDGECICCVMNLFLNIYNIPTFTFPVSFCTIASPVENEVTDQLKEEKKMTVLNLDQNSMKTNHEYDPTEFPQKRMTLWMTLHRWLSPSAVLAL